MRAGWGGEGVEIGTDAWGGAHRRATSEQINNQASRRILEVLPGLDEGAVDFPQPPGFNNAPDKLFNTHFYYHHHHPPLEEGVGAAVKSQTPRRNYVFFSFFVFSDMSLIFLLLPTVR
jgi:hypothetical protein